MDFDVAEPIKKAVHDAVALGDFGYPNVSLGEPFSRFAASRWGWKFDEARVHVSCDVMTGVAEVLAACTRPGAGVVINPPVYPPFFFRTSQSGRHPVEVPLSGLSLDLESLEAALSQPEVEAYLLCSPHNPLGRVWTREELTAVADACLRHGVHLLVDEIHAPLVMSGAEFVPFLSLDHEMSERSVVFHSASKGWNIPGAKCGMIVTGSKALSELVEQRWEALFPSHLGVLATEAALSEAESWLDEVLVQLEANRAALPELAARHLPGVSFVEPQASFLVWLDCRAHHEVLGDDPAAAFLERGRVALSSGLGFGAQGTGHARLNVGTSTELLEEILARLGSVLRA